MTPDLRAQLAALPPLHPQHGTSQNLPCKICGNPAAVFDVLDLHKHCAFENPYHFGLAGVAVPYHRCDRCGFLFTGFFDTWAADDWARYIYNADYARVDPDYTGDRPRRLAQNLGTILRGCETLRILDYGSGSGIFAECLRAQGFSQIETYDPFSHPGRPAPGFAIITCLEVLEHTVDPRAALADMQSLAAPGGAILFSQSVQPADIHAVRGAWWYLAPRNGHISTYTVATLGQLRPNPRDTLHGNGWLWAYVPHDAAPAIAQSMARIGPAISAITLAPPQMANTAHTDDDWHDTEKSAAGKFRWSKIKQLTWVLPPLPTLPAQLHMRLPYSLEIHPGFAAACTLAVNGCPAKTTVTPFDICAVVTITQPYANLTITLQTPPPCSPFAQRGAPDTRALGLAIPFGQ